jgi:hypothetical protein
MVRPVDLAGAKVQRTVWRSSDAIASWTWPGCEGRTTEVEVYADADEVELLQDGRSLGRRRAGRRAGWMTRFRVPYRPGELVAVGYRGGQELGRSVLRTAGPTELRLRVEPGTGAVRFLWVEFSDAAGEVDPLRRELVELEVVGAELVGFGSAAPSTTESFVGARHTTYRGRALAVLRPVGGGRVRARATVATGAMAELAFSNPPVGADTVTSTR